MFNVKAHISHRLFAVLLCVSVLPMALLGMGAAQLGQKVLEDTAFMHMSTIAEDHANHLNYWMHERLNDLRLLAHLPSIQTLCGHCPASGCPTSARGPDDAACLDDSTHLPEVLNLLRKSTPDYLSISILDRDGNVLGSAGSETGPSTHIRDTAVYKRMLAERQPIFGDPFPYRNVGWYVHLMAPVFNDHDVQVGSILVLIDLSTTLQPIMGDRAGLGTTGDTYLLTGTGHIVTRVPHLDRAAWLHQSFHSPGIDAALKHQSGAAIYTNYRGHEVVGAYRWLPEYQWAILAEMDRQEILAPVSWLKTAVFLVVLSVAGLSLLVAWLVSRSIARPVIEVAEASRRMAEGELNQRIVFSGSDEVGTWAANFNTMSEKLSETIEALRNKEQSLKQAYDQQKALQDQLVQWEKMAAVGELVASVVHEMRNTLSSVKLNLQILGRSLTPEDRLFEHFEIALNQAMLLEKMFGDLLDYSKPVTLNRIRCSADDLIQRSLKQLQIETRQFDMEVIPKPLEEPVALLADPEKLVQALVNVIKNAFEAAGSGGRIEIGVYGNGSGQISLEVTDDGPGIQEKNIPRLFQPFFTTKTKGTGLGLSIVKKIVEAHGGRILIESCPGKGTTVRLVIRGLA